MIAEPDASQILTSLESLERKVNALLPPQYQFGGGQANPRSMGSAGLKYGPDAKVLWNEIWTTFCDLAIAGGPPHRGSLLDAPTPDEVAAEPAGYQLVSEEIARGIRLTTDLAATPAAKPGWVEVPCADADMASWLLRAIMAENVFVRQRDTMLYLPAGPAFRIAKEIKNVVVSLTKSFHYWDCHVSNEQRQAAAAAMQGVTLLQPATRSEILLEVDRYREAGERMAQQLAEASGLKTIANAPLGWVGVRFPDEMTAGWFVRATVASDILTRREEEVLFLPVIPPEPGVERFTVVERWCPLLPLWTMINRTH